MTPETLAERTDHEWHPNNRKEHTMTEMTPLYIDPRTVPAEPEDPRVELLAEDLEASGQCCFDIWPCDRADEWRNDARNILARLDAAGGRVVSPAYVINALVTDQGVNMGDHGQDVVRAVAVDPTETVESLLARTLYDHDWQGELSGVKADSYLIIRLAAVTERGAES